MDSVLGEAMRDLHGYNPLDDKPEPEGCRDVPHGVQVDTAYGLRRTCVECSRRWTIINGDREWVEEKFSSMRESIEEGIRRHEQNKQEALGAEQRAR